MANFIDSMYDECVDSESSASVVEKGRNGRAISKGLADYHLHDTRGVKTPKSIKELKAKAREQLKAEVADNYYLKKFGL